MVLAPLLKSVLSFGFCNILRNENSRNDAFREIFPSLGRDFGYLGRALYYSVCDEPLDPPTDPPFDGGQCEFCYNVTSVTTQSNTGFPALDVTQTRSVLYWGPIRFISAQKIRLNETEWAFQVKLSTHGICGEARSDQPQQVLHVDSTSTESAVSTLDSLAVVPSEGQPDDCGSQPPPTDRPVLPPEDRRFPININLPGIDPTFNFDGFVAFGFGYFDLDFNLNFPIQFQLNNNVNITGNFNLNTGDININWGSDYDYPIRPAPPGEYSIDPDDEPPLSREPPPPDFDPPSDPPTGPDEDPRDFDPEKPQKAPRVRRIVGVLVDVTETTPTATELSQNPNPDVYVPDVGLVNFAYMVGGARFYWSEDIRVKNRRQVIFTPPGRYAVDVRGTPRGNTQWVLTPLYENVQVPEVAAP